jgi:hypothetical protein
MIDIQGDGGPIVFRKRSIVYLQNYDTAKLAIARLLSLVFLLVLHRQLQSIDEFTEDGARMLWL